MCGILFLISEVIREKPQLKTMTQALLKSSSAVDDGDDNDLEVFVDAEDTDEQEGDDTVENPKANDDDVSTA